MSELRHIIGTANLFTDGQHTYEGHRCETCDGLGWRFDSKNPGPHGAWPRVHCEDCDNSGYTFERCGQEHA